MVIVMFRMGIGVCNMAIIAIVIADQFAMIVEMFFKMPFAVCIFVMLAMGIANQTAMAAFCGVGINCMARRGKCD